MNGLETRLFCRLDGVSAAAKEQQRLFTVAELGLLETDRIPVFEEAAQTAAQFLDAPVCWMSVLDRDTLWLKAAIGLSTKLGLMNPLAKTRRMAREESFDTHVVDSQQVLALSDAALHPAFAQSALVQQFGIRAYLGAPLVTSSGQCLGTLAILHCEPREFNERDIQSLELVARWCVSEFERDQALLGTTSENQPLNPASPRGTLAPEARDSSNGLTTSPHAGSNRTSRTSQPEDPSPLRLKLVGQLTQQLRAPLTAVLGMAGMLSREIYGPLTDKQREYLEVIQRSGQTLLSLIQEIMDLAALDDGQGGLNLTPVDVELLGQKVLHSLTAMGNQQDLQLQCSVEPGKRVWRLDKDKIRQMLYHLLFSIIQSANGGSVVQLHISRKTDQLQFSLWVSHPWLGEGLLPNNDGDSLIDLPISNDALNTTSLATEAESGGIATVERLLGALSAPLNSENLNELLQATSAERPENLRLLLSRHLAEIQGGQLFVQSSSESGYRYIALLPISNFDDSSDSL
jgi:hypothetical protein